MLTTAKISQALYTLLDPAGNVRWNALRSETRAFGEAFPAFASPGWSGIQTIKHLGCTADRRRANQRLTN